MSHSTFKPLEGKDKSQVHNLIVLAAKKNPIYDWGGGWFKSPEKELGLCQYSIDDIIEKKKIKRATRCTNAPA